MLVCIEEAFRLSTSCAGERRLLLLSAKTFQELLGITKAEIQPARPHPLKHPELKLWQRRVAPEAGPEEHLPGD